MTCSSKPKASARQSGNSCMRERVYGPRPPTASDEENIKSSTQPQPGLARRADRGVASYVMRYRRCMRR